MTTVTGQFDTAEQTSGQILVLSGASYSLDFTFSAGGTVVLEDVNGQVSRSLIATYTASESLTIENNTGRDLRLSLRLVDVDEGETVDYTLANYTAATSSSVGTLTAQTANITSLNQTNAPSITGTTASNVVRFLLDGSGNALLARCATANIPTGAGFAKGCILIATDGTDHTNTLFANIGNATTANFNAVSIASD